MLQTDLFIFNSIRIAIPKIYRWKRKRKLNHNPSLCAAFTDWPARFRAAIVSVEPTLPRMHSAHFASGLALFLERIGTRSQDWINEGSFAQKVTCFSVNVRQLTRNWRRSVVVGMQPDRPASTRSSSASPAPSSLAPKTVDSGRVVCVSGPSAMPTVLCYNFLKRGVAQIGVKTRLHFGNHSTPGSYLPTGLTCINIHDPLFCFKLRWAAAGLSLS